MKIGVFDSGIGGRAVARDIRTAFSNAEVVYVNDSANVPYGTKSPEQILQLTKKAILPLVRQSCDVIVVACNTATAIAIEPLRNEFPNQQFIGLEPMVKPAAKMSRTRIVAVCATPATLSSKRYKIAKNRYKSEIRIIEPDCREWASLIEANQINRQHIRAVTDWCLSRNADIIVLACTHYHWIRNEIEDVVGGSADVIEPTEAIVQQIRVLLQRL